MKHAHAILFSFLILMCNLGYSQTGNYQDAVLPKQNMEKSPGIAPGLDLSTGIVSPSIHLMDLKGRMQDVSIDLVYTHGQGLRASDVASIVGWGWDLQVGGKIEREIKGIYDEKKFGEQNFNTDDPNQSGWLDDYIHTNTSVLFHKQIRDDVQGTSSDECTYNGVPCNCPSSYPPLSSYENHLHQCSIHIPNQFCGYETWTYNIDFPNPGIKVSEMNDFYNNPIPPNGITQEIWQLEQKKYFFNSWANNQYAEKQFDTEPDVFTFTFGQYHGQFVFNKDGYPVIFPFQDIKIEPAIGPHSSHTWWTFITPDGFKYNFSSQERTMVGHDGYLWNHSPDTYEYISTWFLNSIIDPLGSAINFSYTGSETYTNVNIKGVCEPDFIPGYGSRIDIFNGCNTTSCEYPTNAPDRYINILTKKELSSISSEYGSIQFYYDSQYRYDMPYIQNPQGIWGGFHSLKNIKLFDNSGNNTKTFEFNYDYIGIPTASGYFGASVPDRHLRLQSLYQIPTTGASSPLIYTFNYENFTPAPAGDRYWKIDKWGFFNGNISGVMPSTICTLSNCLSFSNNSLILKEAGRTEGSDRLASESYTKEGILKQIIYPSGGSIEYEYEINKYLNTSGQNENWGGLRIKRIIEKPNGPGNSLQSIKEIKYTQESDATKSSGEVIPHRRQYDFVDYYSSAGLPHGRYLLRYSDPNRDNTKDFIRYAHVEVIEQGNGKTTYDFTGYTSNPDISSSRWNFNPDNTTCWTQYFNDKDNDAGASFIDQSMYRGLLLKKCSYMELPSGSSASQDELKIEEINYNYEFAPSNYVPELVVASRINCDQKIYQANSNVNSVKSFNVESYYYQSNWFYLKETSKKIFAQNGNIYDPNNFQIAQTTFSYNSWHPSQIQSIKTINSDNKVTGTNYVYPTDLQDNPHILVISEEARALRRMVEANIINRPIESFVRDETDPNHLLTLNSIHVSFHDFGLSNWNINMYLPQFIYINRYKVPSDNFSQVHLINNSNVTIDLIQDNNYELDYIYDDYDKYGHVKSEHRNKGPVKSHLWGYGSCILPIADFLANKNENKITVSGSSLTNVGNECSYLGFESSWNPEESDYWSYDPNGHRSMVINTEAHTGKKSQKVLQAGNIIIPVDPTPIPLMPEPNMNLGRSSPPFSYSAGHVFMPDDQQRIYKFGAWIKTSTNYQTDGAWLVMDVLHHDGTDIIDQSNDNKGYHYASVINTSGQWKYFSVSVNLEEFRSQFSSLLNQNDNQLNLLCYLVNYDNTNNNYVLIDDIRFNSIEAQGSSYTYDSSWVKSSVSDVNNLPTFFHFDGFNRMEGVENFRNEVLLYSAYYVNNNYNSNSPNFNKSLIPKVPKTLTDLRNVPSDLDNFIISTDYSDGIGRTIQKNIKDYYTDGSYHFDLINPGEYNQYGRQPKSYLPYTYSNNGNFDPNFSNHLLSFYTNADKVAHDTKPYTDNVFENSEIGRLNEQSPYGNNWNLSSGHTIKNDFNFNVSNEIQHWTILRDVNNDYSGALSDGNYSSNSLIKTKTVNEENRTTYIFYDMRGKIVCKKIEAYTDQYDKTSDFTDGHIGNSGGTQKLYSIYYVYDEFYQLIYTITVQNDHSLITSITDDVNLSDPFFKGRVEANHYDSHGRVIEHHVCDGGWERYIYNSQDQCVMFQNPKLYETNEWYIFKYDALGRSVITGISNLGGLNQQQIQSNVDNDIISYVKTTTAASTGYSIDDTYPQTIDNIHVINYFDKYNFNDQSLAGRNYQQINSDDPSAASNYVTGKLTASKVRVLPSGDYLSSVNYYDDDGRLLQKHNQNYVDYPNSWDILGAQYLFTGNVNKSTRLHSAFSVTTQIVTRYVYDRIGRQTDIYKQVNSEPEVHFVNNVYNSLGQLTRKTLHDEPVWNNQFLQGIDYRYNIHGLLSSINNAELTNDGVINFDDNDVFGEQIYYDDPNISNQDFQPLPYYDGKISQIIWRTKPISGSVSFDLRPIHLYTYRYDDFGRLTAGYYASNSAGNPISFDQNINRFLEKESYDIHGNIQSLLRNSDRGMPIDDLQYTYTTQSNQLASIVDNSGINPHANDFHNGATNTYEYDSDGNLKTDNNKGINSDYNFLNLPEQITGQGSLNFIYDAAGNKLASTIDGITHYYVNGIEYEGSEMQFINTEEGRIRKLDSYGTPSNIFVYDYFIKDHLGNIRVVLTTQINDDAYYATMEIQNGAVEEQLFYNISTTRDFKLPGYPIDNSYVPDSRASELSIALNRTIGHAKVLSVNGDDVVHLNTKYFFHNTAPDTTNLQPLSDILNQLAMAFIINPSNGVSIAGGEQGAQQTWANNTFLANPELNNFLTNSFNENQLNNPGQPKAFLVWLFFSADNFQFVPEVSGLLQATNADQLGDLGILDLTIPVNGYLYVYVTNESTQTVDFDHLTIIHQRGRCLEENHYYPYGMLIESLSYNSGIAHNNYKFNGDHYETHNGIFNYLANYRGYDPTIAKWNQLDPMNQFSNGYLAYGANPVSLADPLGLTVNFLKGGNGGSDAPTERERGDAFERGYIGGGGFTDAGGSNYSMNELIAASQLIQFYNDLPTEVRDALGRNAADLAFAVIDGEILIHITPPTYTVPILHYGIANGQLTASNGGGGGVILTPGQTVTLEVIAESTASFPVIGEIIDGLVATGMIIYNATEDMAGETPIGKIRRIGDDEMRRMQKNGFDPHDFKPPQGNNGSIDFFKDQNGWVFWKQTNATNYTPTYENLWDILNTTK